MRYLMLCAALWTSPAWADGCPVAPNFDKELDALHAALEQAPSQLAARELNAQLWRFWLQAPDAPSQAMLNDGMRARQISNYPRALERLNALVGYCPFYAEGYNQRAFVNYLAGDYAAALPDLDETLKINPRHIGALAGKALTLLALGDEAAGQVVLREALALNPWLGERALLRDPPKEEL